MLPNDPVAAPCARQSRAERWLDQVAAWAALALIVACIVYIAHLAILAYL